MHIAGAHHHHLIAAALNGFDPPQRRPTRARFVKEPGHVAGSVAYERLRAPRKRSDDEFSITFGIGVQNFKEEVELIYMIAFCKAALHAQAPAGFGRAVT